MSRSPVGEPMPDAGDNIVDFGPDWQKHCPNAYRVALFRRNWRTSACGRYMFSSETSVAKRWDALIPNFKVAKPVAEQAVPTGAVPKAYRIPKSGGNDSPPSRPAMTIQEKFLALAKVLPDRKPTVASVVKNISWPVAGSGGPANPINSCQPEPKVARASMNARNVGRPNRNAGPEPRQCVACGAVEDHPVHRCRLWQGYTVNQRRLVLRQFNRCENCLKANHLNGKPCYGGECPHCPGGQMHNSWLCPVMEATMQRQRHRHGPTQ